MKESDKQVLFEEVFREFKDPIYRTCCSYARSSADREDLFQEIFANIWKGLDKLRNTNALKTWTYRVSYNTALSWVIKRRKLGLVEINENVHLKVELLDQTSDQKNLSEENLDFMYSCINKLPVHDKALITMVLEDLSTAEIAEIVGITQGNVRVKIHRIKNQLRKLMGVQNGI